MHSVAVVSESHDRNSAIVCELVEYVFLACFNLVAKLVLHFYWVSADVLLLDDETFLNDIPVQGVKTPYHAHDIVVMVSFAVLCTPTTIGFSLEVS